MRGRRNINQEARDALAQMRTLKAVRDSKRRKLVTDISELDQGYEDAVLEPLREYLSKNGVQSQAMKILNVSRPKWAKMLERVSWWERHRNMNPWNQSKEDAK